MSIQLVCISHKTAPLHIRELFAFSEEEQVQIMHMINAHEAISESVVIATCNRTEIYTYSAKEDSSREVYDHVQNVLYTCVKRASEEDISQYIRFFDDEHAIRHLFKVACGLDSMVIGEDQILGQVKSANQLAMDHQTSGTYLNAFFRHAVTASKKVKTETKLSKTPVSTASICIKTAEGYLGKLAGKKVMVIGATGKIGGIVMKNLLADYKPEVYVTMRNFDGEKDLVDEHHHYKYKQISYDRRYEYLKDMDVVISATASPHYTLTYENVVKYIEPGKKMAFMDLAVPLDIESRIGSLEGIGCFNIDDFSKTAKDNNRKKMKEAGAAIDIIDEYIVKFRKWMLFQESLKDMQYVHDTIVADFEKKGIDHAINKFFFRLRESASVEELEHFMNSIRNYEL